ncbi:MAG TPA: MFS transporter [Acidimicrobiales bacterium]|nr:MFS transporter [Acidimicrobiales bacterium]
MLSISAAEGVGRTGRRDLVIALSGRMVSAFGDAVALIALTLRLQAGGAGPYVVALLFGAGTAPLLLLAGAVGHLVDSHDSRRLLVGAGLLAVACTAPLVVVHSVVVILVLVALLAVATSVASSAWSALVPRMVGEDGVAAAVSAQQSLNALVTVGAPAVGGLLAGAFGSGVPLALDAGTFVVVTMAAALVRTRRGPAEPDPDAPSAAPRGGFHLLRADPVLAPLTVGLGLVVLLVGMVDVVLVYLVRETLHAGGVWYGVAEASWMAGIVGGSLGAGRLRTEPRQTWATIGGAGLACAALAPFALVPAVWMLVPLSIVGGIGNGLAIACFSTLLIRRTPDAERGRVSAAAGATIGSAQGLSLLAGGGLATVLRPRAVYGTAGLLGLAGAAATATSLAFGRRKGQAEKTVC